MVKKKTKKSVKISKDLTIHFMPFSEIARENSIGRVKKIMGHVLNNKLIILQGKLHPEDEKTLIANSMTLIGNIKGFQGIEIATISGEKGGMGLFNKIRHNIAKILVGEQDSMTIIGPATIVKEMKKDPSQMEVLLKK